MTFVNFWLDLGDGDGLFYSLDTGWTWSPHFVSLDRGNQRAIAGGVMVRPISHSPAGDSKAQHLELELLTTGGCHPPPVSSLHQERDLSRFYSW